MGRCFEDTRLMWRIIGILLVFITAGTFLAIFCSQLKDESTGPDWKEELVISLRTYEVDWTDEMSQDWQEKITYPIDYTVPYAAYETYRFEPGHQVMRIGTETIYTEDFNYQIFLHNFADFVSSDPVSEDVIVSAAQRILEDSVLLQESDILDVVELDESVFNSESKDFIVRADLVTTARDELPQRGLARTEGEQITVWFYNTEEPDMGVDAAEDIANGVISDLHDRLVAGTITFEQAGEEIRSNPTLAEIDYGIDGNAYERFVIYGDLKETYHDPDIGEAVDGLPVGEISEVLTGRDKGEDWYDAFYAVVHVDSRTEGFDNFDVWLEDTMDIYTVTVFRNNGD